jgi:hypothetical protein
MPSVSYLSIVITVKSWAFCWPAPALIAYSAFFFEACKWWEILLIPWIVIQCTAALSLQKLAVLPLREHQTLLSKETKTTATQGRLLPNTQTQNRLPDSRLFPNADSTIPQHRRHHSLIYSSFLPSCHRQILVWIFSHLTNCARIQSSFEAPRGGQMYPPDILIKVLKYFNDNNIVLGQMPLLRYITHR